MKIYVTRVFWWFRGVLRSWTMWFNNIMLTVWAVLPILLEQLPALRPYISAELYRELMLVIIVGNILLRIKTTKSLTERGT